MFYYNLLYQIQVNFSWTSLNSFICLSLQGCLTMDPAQRLSCTTLLQHPYMDQNKEIYDSPNRKDKPERNKNKSVSRASNHYVSFPVIKNQICIRYTVILSTHNPELVDFICVVGFIEARWRKERTCCVVAIASLLACDLPQMVLVINIYSCDFFWGVCDIRIYLHIYNFVKYVQTFFCLEWFCSLYTLCLNVICF